MPKNLMVMRDDQLLQVQVQYSEAGMNFHVLDTPAGFVAVLSDGVSLPYYRHGVFYDVDDLLAGVPVPRFRDITGLTVSAVFSDRASALIALRAANISPLYTGGSGAFPLVASYVLASATVFCRYVSAAIDPRFIGGALTAGTYLTAKLDSSYANTGFSAVGRFALPLPLPACHVFQYELPPGTTINVGTVAPAFGQAGGGVEVYLPTRQAAIRVGASVVPEY